MKTISIFLLKKASLRALAISILVLFFLPAFAQEETDSVKERKIALSEYRDKMMAGWIGQMVGVGWGAPTEFVYQSRIIPADEVPQWSPDMVNVYGQDDLYVEMTFLRSMEKHGFDLSIQQAGIDFANSKYLLWVANASGRKNLRNGIAPPNSGHPMFNSDADAIDYQIEADYSGLISPGLPHSVIELGEKFGRLMNYGDGLYGGQFVGGMYVEAFFENDPLKIVQAGLKCIPEGSQYAEAVRDVISWHTMYPDNFEKSWELINEKYHENPDYRKFTSSDDGSSHNIDAKLNGAYIVMGMLYGNGDPDRTIIVSMRCGQDSDCNPSNAAGILFTTIGFENLPQRFTSGLDTLKKFSFTDYSFPELIDICEKFAIEMVQNAGGRIEVDTDGAEVLVIPVLEPVPGSLEQSWNPGPVSQNSFSKEELRQIKGSKIFNYSLLILILLVVLVFKENRNIRGLLILLPFLILYFLLELLRLAIPSAMLEIMDIVVVFQSFAAVIAILLLLGHKIVTSKRVLTAGAVLLVPLLLGIVGTIGATDGRVIASTKFSIVAFLFQAIIWLLAIFTTVFLNRKTYRRARFSLSSLLSLFVFQFIGFSILVLIIIPAISALGDKMTGLSTIMVGAFLFSVVHFILILFYLVPTYFNSSSEERLLAFFNRRK